MRKQLYMKDVDSFSKMNTIDDCKRFLQVMLDFYFDAIISQAGKESHSFIENDLSLWIQTIFSKGNFFMNLLDGVGYDNEGRNMNPIIDTSVLFSIARSMYESLIVFEILFVLPKSQDEQTILYNLFMAHGLQERFKDIDENMKMQNPQRVRQEKVDIDECMNEINDTTLYKGMDKQLQNKIQNAFGKRYRYTFTPDGDMKFVEFEHAYELLNVREEFFFGMYSFSSLHSHPSYLYLCQFRDSYKNENRADISMAKFATQCVLSYMSIMIIDYMKLKPDVKELFDNLELARRFAIKMYENITRDKSKRENLDKGAEYSCHFE